MATRADTARDARDKDAVESAIDRSKGDRSVTWEKALRDRAAIDGWSARRAKHSKTAPRKERA